MEDLQQEPRRSHKENLICDYVLIKFAKLFVFPMITGKRERKEKREKNTKRTKKNSAQTACQVD